MKSPVSMLSRCLYPAVFAAWTVFPAYLLISRRYIDFLRPELGILLAAAQCIALAFLLAAIVRLEEGEVGAAPFMRSLVLLMPILYYVAMPDTILGNQAFTKRFTGTGNAISGDRGAAMGFLRGPGDNTDFSPRSASEEPSPQALPPERTLLEIFLNPGMFQGQRLVVTGMITRDEQLKAHFGGSDTALYRFLINCCAADALPLAIGLESDQTDAFAVGQWVRVDGIFHLRQIDGAAIPILSDFCITAVEAPSVPYLF